MSKHDFETEAEAMRNIDEAMQPPRSGTPAVVPGDWFFAEDDGKGRDLDSALVTIAVPSLDQGRYLDQALRSIFEQDLPVEVFVADGGSSDETLDVIHRWESKLAGWRSAPDDGQAAAINEAIRLGSAPLVCWLNSDDYLIPGGLRRLVDALREDTEIPAVYGGVLNLRRERFSPLTVEPFSPGRLAVYCIVSQPGSLIRRSVWDAVGGVREDLHLAFDYDLWWRIYKHFGPMQYVSGSVAVNRDHALTKTNGQRRRHYEEAIMVVRRHHGRVPLKWYVAQPYAIWYRALSTYLRSLRSDKP